MPLFEFVCSECGKSFEELVRSSSAADEVTCPVCGSHQVRRKVSTFAARTSGGSSLSFSSSGSSCSTGST
jgi:putative FmdB family regulatory protein